MAARTGLDVMVRDGFRGLSGKSISVLCNQASIAFDYVHLLEHLFRAGSSGRFTVRSVLGPQHGLWGHTQDNMIEWEGHEDSRLKPPVYSLYGERREPTDEMLSGVDALLVDLPDVGSRYYTFIWTTALCLKACSERNIRLIVLDRPNPIGGEQVEGTVLDPGFASFVGLYPLPIRHGMTLGEIAVHLKASYFPASDLDVVRVEGWKRRDYQDEAGLLWSMPSPNLPTLDSALTYPGGCLLEGTTLSEGRGTTRPFEIFGAPYLDGWTLSRRLNDLQLEGVYFRPVQFQPTFQKHAGLICEGGFVHVTDRWAFKPFLTYVAIIMEVLRLYPDQFEWKSPPYEYEFTRLPFDILAGNGWLREEIEKLAPVSGLEERWRAESTSFEPSRRAALLY